MSAYGDKLDLYDGHLFIYTRADSKKGTYQARMTFPNRTGYVRRSLKTSSRQEAIHAGTSLYLSLRAKWDQHLPLDHMPWLKLTELYIEHRHTERVADTREYLWVITNYIDPFFGHHQDLTKVNSSHIAEYWAYRATYWDNHDTTPLAAAAGREVTNKRPYSKTAAHREAIILRQIFRFAFERGYIGSVPTIRTPTRVNEAASRTRGIFTIPQYKSLIATIAHRIRAAPDEGKARYHLMKVRRLQRLRYWVLLLSGSGIRVNEAKQLTQKQIRLVPDRQTGQSYTQIDLSKEQSKQQRGARTILTWDYHNNYDYYQRWLAVLGTWRPELIGPDKLVFPSFRQFDKPFDQMSAFRLFLKSCDLHIDDNGHARTSYSLRSFYISRRLEAGVPLYVVATNCGTSYDQIYKHYAASLTWTMRKHLTKNHTAWEQKQTDTAHPRERELFDDLPEYAGNLQKTHT